GGRLARHVRHRLLHRADGRLGEDCRRREEREQEQSEEQARRTAADPHPRVTGGRRPQLIPTRRHVRWPETSTDGSVRTFVGTQPAPNVTPVSGLRRSMYWGVVASRDDSAGRNMLAAALAGVARSPISSVNMAAP